MKLTDVKFAEVKAGDILVADGGFTCITEGARLTVQVHEHSDLYVPCDVGCHFLDGQLNHETGELIGFSRAEEV